MGIYKNSRKGSKSGEHSPPTDGVRRFGLRHPSFPNSCLGTHLPAKLPCAVEHSWQEWAPKILCLLILFCATSCKKNLPKPSDLIGESPARATVATDFDKAFSKIDGTVAVQNARALCNLGPRDYASPGRITARKLIAAELQRNGWKIIEQTFDASTPAGSRSFTNLIAIWPSKRTSPDTNHLILAAHYDAPGSRTVTFPTASAGAAGCGVLLEIAQRLASFPELASQLQLVFFDGEEAVQQISVTDGLCGSRFFIHSLKENALIPTVRAMLVFGSVGHAHAHWTLPTMTTLLLNQRLRDIAFKNKWEGQVTDLGRPAWGSHLPAFQAGIPTTFVNDALYPSFATADDSADQLNAESLRRAALTAVEMLQTVPLPDPK